MPYDIELDGENTNTKKYFVYVILFIFIILIILFGFKYSTKLFNSEKKNSSEQNLNLSVCESNFSECKNIFIQGGSEKYCDNFQDSNECYFEIAILQQNPSICNIIQEDNKRNLCLNNFPIGGIE